MCTHNNIRVKHERDMSPVGHESLTVLDTVKGILLTS
jgi:hypothetical protein